MGCSRTTIEFVSHSSKEPSWVVNHVQGICASITVDECKKLYANIQKNWNWMQWFWKQKETGQIFECSVDNGKKLTFQNAVSCNLCIISFIYF
jgi:hypothetical protein